MKKNAFTLIELLVVIVIIGILATIGVASFNDYMGKARNARAQAFSAQAYRKLSTQPQYAVAYWNFEDGETWSDLATHRHTKDASFATAEGSFISGNGGNNSRYGFKSNWTQFDLEDSELTDDAITLMAWIKFDPDLFDTEGGIYRHINIDYFDNGTYPNHLQSGENSVDIGYSKVSSKWVFRHGKWNTTEAVKYSKDHGWFHFMQTFRRIDSTTCQFRTIIDGKEYTNYQDSCLGDPIKANHIVFSGNVIFDDVGIWNIYYED
jgi:prepilin-type N-terminal cleavage/methylation domain-containing protein